MAIIFYHRDSGLIYGVHPDRNITVPEGVDTLDVPAEPDTIAWPARGGRGGREHWSRVVNKALVLRDDLAPIAPEHDADLLKTRFTAATTLSELKAVLKDILGL